MRLATTILGLLSAVPAMAASGVAGEVTYVHADGVYLDRGRAAGVEPGTRVAVVRRAEVIATLEVADVADHSSFARVLDAQGPIRPGMGARFREVRPAVQAPAPTRPAAVVWKLPAFGRVPFSGAGEPPALRRVRSSAHLRGSTWVYVDAGESRVAHRDRLRLTVSGPLDTEGRFWVDANLGVTGRPVTPDDGPRFRGDESVWVDVHRAQLAYRRDAWAVALGRAPAGRLRYGLLDGATFSYVFDGGPRLTAAAGGRPETLTLGPSFERWVAVVDVSGSVAMDWGLFSYAGSASWLGANGATEAAEASAQLGLGLGGHWWLLAEAGIFVLTHAGRDPRGILDRASVSATYTFIDRWTARLAIRRWQDADLPSERLRLPVGYLTTGPTWAALASVDGILARWGSFALHGRVASGGGLAEKDDQRRWWTTPAVTLTASRWWRLRLRLGYRLELGWVGGHHAEGAVGVEPVDGLRIDLGQQAGVVTLTTNETLPAYSTWLRLGVALRPWLRIGARARARFGEAGEGVEASVWAAAHDLL